MSAATPTGVDAYLQSFIARCDDVPLIGDLNDDDLDTPRGDASIARAALCWRREGQPDAIAERIRDELVVADFFARYRVRMAGHDIRNAIDDWPRVFDVVAARREYRSRWGVA